MGARGEKMSEKKYRVKGIAHEIDKPREGIEIKLYDEKSVFITSGITDKKGKFDITSDIMPKYYKATYEGAIISTADILLSALGVADLGVVVLCLIPPEEWHIKGVVRDKMSGEPLNGLIIEAWDIDIGSPVTYHDPLGEDVTDNAGEFNIWFDASIFQRTATTFNEYYPDIYLKVKIPPDLLIHQTPVDYNVLGTPHDCGIYCIHKGVEYLLDIDYVTAVINKLGPVSTTDIDSMGKATHQGIIDRPFGGNITIYGRIWGSKVVKWRLSYGAGLVDSDDSRFSGLGPSDPDPFTTIADGTSLVWDGPIYTWSTDAEGPQTIILVVWDNQGNEFHDTQLVFLHNAAITPPSQIILPASGDTINKTTSPMMQIQGTASDDYFHSYGLLWAGCSQTELTGANITYPTAGNTTPVVNGLLGTLDIGTFEDGPYVIRLSVHDRTILNDGATTRSDWTWHTITIES